MNKKLQVFVSSTYTDLIEERQAAVEAILDAGHIPAGMELFKAGKSQMETIQKWIDESDVYMLILGGRYGSIEKESGLSYTELEYRYALSKQMPVFAIVLEEKFLFIKAASCNKNDIFEKDNIDKYDSFMTFIKAKIVHFAKSKEHIQSIIKSELQNILIDSEYSDKLIGWCKPNHAIPNYNIVETNILNEQFYKIVNEIFFRNCNIKNPYYTSKFSEQMFYFLNPKAILESSNHSVDIELLDDRKNIKVITATANKFSYIKSRERYFQIYSLTTRQQAYSFKVETVQINGIDYTSQVLTSVTKIPNRGQFTYVVDSDFTPPNISYCDLYYVTSYICPALDFFQSRKLLYPCNNFTVSVTLKNDINQLYTILASSFSPFSKFQYDDFKSSEVHKFSTCTINLPTWSLPGAGYAITLKNKSINNHI